MVCRQTEAMPFPKGVMVLVHCDNESDFVASLSRSPGGGSGNGHRTITVGLWAWFEPEADCLVYGAALVTSGLAPSRPDCSLLLHLPKSRFVPAKRNLRLWDCKVTPAYCACQEGNTTCCICSNDGLGAGVRILFSTRAIHRPFTKLDSWDFWTFRHLRG
jgi:hypothetical protein